MMLTCVNTWIIHTHGECKILGNNRLCQHMDYTRSWRLQDVGKQSLTSFSKAFEGDDTEDDDDDNLLW